MHSELRCCCNSTTEPEEDVRDVQYERQKWMDGEALLDRLGYEVKERKHADDRDEHVVVDDRRRGEGIVNDIANNCHY